MIEVSSKEARELICHTCGFANMIGEKYCSECGAPLAHDPPAPPVRLVELISDDDEETDALNSENAPESPIPLTPPPVPETPPSSLRPGSETGNGQRPGQRPSSSRKDKQVYCRYCGSKNILGNKYCHECGAPLVSHTHPNQSVQATQSAVRARKSYKPEDDEDAGPTLLPENAVLQGRYQITKLIGQGGMGAIYLADDLRFSRRVAVIKEMLDHFTDPDQRRTATSNFDREAEMLANLKHMGIPEVYDRFTEGNRHYLVMEYIDGADLEQRLLAQDNAPFEEHEVLDWSVQICEILSYLHEQDPAIVYRDMKPANLILNKKGKIYVVDFGIARHFNPTKKGTMIGTQGYAPPEQYRGQVEPRSDIYALAATVHHLLTGRDPQGEAPFSFPPLREENPKISPPMEKLVARCLSMEPEARFKNAREMMEALQKIGSRRSSPPPTIPGTVPIQSRGISTALMKLGLSHKLFSAEWLLRLNIVLLSIIVILLVMLLAKN
ncbi:MAG: protein kinase [Candidatus Sericytochromatia bacterium]|nr:protein kinase [Candidatus Sericytochromatia bacterium]